MDKKMILIADDEKDVILLVSRILGKDYDVVGASDGKEAVNIARKQKPDIILMDIMMPEMDGYTACSLIKSDQETGAIPVVMVSAIGQELNKKLAKKLGADGYVTKPFSQQELLDAVVRFLSRHK